MSAIVKYVAKNPGCSMIEAARGTRNHPHEGHKYGYAAIYRCIRAGLICKTAAHRGPKLTITPSSEEKANSDER